MSFKTTPQDRITDNLNNTSSGLLLISEYDLWTEEEYQKIMETYNIIVNVKR